MIISHFRLKPVVFCIATAFAAAAFALPTAPTVTSGSATFATSGGTLTVTNTPSAIINWGSFSIGQNEITRFIQQSSTSAVLNRVVGQDPSQILGQLQSNGRVFLINPNGILFGAGARIDTAGLIASTLALSDADLLAGRMRFTGTGTEGKVENRGTIDTANGGFVYLIAPIVENSGIIRTPNGDILLAAGQSVEIADGLNPALRVQITAPEGQATNLGQLLAESGRIGLHAGIVANAGTISASSATAEGGKIYLRAAHRIELGDTSKVGADGTAGGEITAITSKDGLISGELVARGEISAQGNGTTGSGGFVETSAAQVNVNGLRVRTNGGTWLIDPNDFTIAATGGNMTGADVEYALASGDLAIETATMGTAGGNGDIHVNDAISWNSHDLMLNAERNININAVMTATGSASLNLYTGSSGTVNVGFNPDGSFKGRIDFGGRSGADFFYIHDTPYNVINTVTELQGITVLNGKYALGSSFSAGGFSPVGDSGAPFTGVFDGLGHTITGLTINQPGTDYVGLFGATSGAVLRNVGLVNASVIGDEYVGGLAGSAVATTIHNSYADVTLTGRRYLGGLIGNIDYASSPTPSTIRNSHSTGSVTGGVGGNAAELGGLIGSAYSSYGKETFITDSYSTASVTSNSASSSKLGGLVGYLGELSSIADSFATGSINTGSGDGDVIGGLVGESYKSTTITRSYATGNVSVGGYGSDIGGLVGNSWGDWGAGPSTISQSYASGAISVTGGASQIGGLAGFNTQAISDSYATGSISISGSHSEIGGLVGYNNYATITRTYATGAISVSGTPTYVGGLIGRSDGTGNVSLSYWDIDTTGQATSAGTAGGVTGKTTAEMKQQATFSGWDFTNVWNIDAGTSYPYLRNPEQVPHPGLVGGPSTCTICSWDGGGSDFKWGSAANWLTNLLPGAGSTVTIGSGYGTILFDINSLSLASITTSSPLEIQSGKTLTLTGSAAFNAAVSGSGTLDIAGAAVNVNASTLNIASLNLASGSLSGGGVGGGSDLTVSNNFNWTGGTFGSGFGTLSITQSSGPLNIIGNISAGNVSLFANDFDILGNIATSNHLVLGTPDYGLTRGLSLGLEDGTRASLSAAELGRLSFNSSQFYGKDLVIGGPVTFASAGDTQLVARDLVRVDAPLTFTNPTSSVFLQAVKVDINAAVTAGSGGVYLGANASTEAFRIGIPDGVKPGAANTLELSNTELNRIVTTGAITIGDPYNNGSTKGDMQIVGAIDLTGNTDRLRLSANGITQATGATITVQKLVAESWSSIVLTEANQVSGTALRTHGAGADIAFRSAASGGLTVGSVNTGYFTTSGITASGDIFLTTPGALGQTAAAPLSGNKLTLDVGGNVNLDTVANPISKLNVIAAAGGAITAVSGVTIDSGDTLKGIGTLTGNVTNSGTLAPGGSGTVGTLNIVGNLTLGATGSVELDVGGTGTGQSDKINVTGNVTMGGALNRYLVGGYTPALGDAIPFLTMTGTASGTFATENTLASLVTGYRLAPGETARQIFSGPGYNTFTNRAGGLTWETGGNWSAGYIPDYTQTAIITSDPLSPVVHGTGTDSIAGLLIDAGNALSFTGGSLAVSGTTSVGGTLSLSGGTFANNGTLNVTGIFNITGGILAGSGSLANSGSMTLANQTITNAITNTGTFNSGGGLIFNLPFTNNSGTFNVNAGTTTFLNGYSQSAGNLVLNNADVAGNLALSGGTLKGAGNISGNVSLGAASLAPGFSPGTLNITGNLTLAPTSTTTIELWGTGTGQFDVINVSGTANLAGTLNAITGNGYVPGAGHALRFMTFANSTGSFASQTLPSGMTLSALINALDLLGPAYSSNSLPPSFANTLPMINNMTNLGALSYDTPLLYVSGQSSTTASSRGTRTQTAELLLPALIPDLEETNAESAPQNPRLAALMPVFEQLALDANRREFPHDSRLVCR